MPFFDTTWYVSSAKYAAVTARPQNTAVVAGQLVRQFTTPAVNSERVFVCVVAGTTANTTDATWNVARGGKITDGTAQWMECTGASAVNGDLTNTPSWNSLKGLNVGAGHIIKRNSGASYQINTTAGNITVGSGAEPAFSDTAGVTTGEAGGTWTSLGPVGNFPAWGAPHARLQNAYATNWGAPGNKFWIADNHAETQIPTMQLVSQGTMALPSYAICVDRTAALPPVEANYNTGASIGVTGAASIRFTSFVVCNQFYQGITFSAGDGANNNTIDMIVSQQALTFKNCLFKLGGTGPSSAVLVGGSGNTNYILWDNCAVQFAAAGQGLKLQTAQFEWKNTPTPFQGAIRPTALFILSIAGCAGSAVVRGVDFSSFSGQLLVNNSPTSASILLEDCKLHPSMVRYGTSDQIGPGMSPVITVRCDSGATNYKATRDEYAGKQETETSIVRAGGATDGTTPSSIKVTTNAQATFLAPYRMLRLAAWNDVVGADRTVTVCGTVNSASLPNNDEIWMDVQYLGSSGSPVASFKTTCKAHPLAANAAVAADNVSAWNGVGGGTGAPLDTVASVTGAWSFGRNMLTSFGAGTRYTKTGTAITALNNQSGASNRDLTDTGISSIRPVETTAFPASVLCADFDGGNQYLFCNTTGMSSFITASSGAMVCSVIIDAVTVNNATIYGNHGIMADTSGYLGLYARALSGVTFYSYNDGGGAGASGAGAVATPYVLMWRHHGGNIYFSINGGTEVLVASGNTASLGGGLLIGFGYASKCNMKFAEGFTTSDGSQTAALAAAIANMKTYLGIVEYTPFKLTATLTSPQPQMKGYLYANIRAARPSTIYYIDPQITLS